MPIVIYLLIQVFFIVVAFLMRGYLLKKFAETEEE